MADGAEQHTPPSQKRKDAPLPTGTKPSKKVKRVGPRADSKVDSAALQNDSDKAKRVRTGCLTCRSRHLKCDETLPNCNNCLKSNRACERGVRLNFIDTLVEEPPHIVTLYGTRDWKVQFLDESREIASEYQGGSQHYKPLEVDVPMVTLSDHDMYAFSSAAPPAPTLVNQALPPMQSMLPPPTFVDPNIQQDVMNMYDPGLKPDSNSYQQMPPPNSVSTNTSHYNNSVASTNGSYNTALTMQQPDDLDAKREYLDTPEDTLFMQVFVEEVGIWMDSLDPHKHFSRLLPFHSLSEPMLLNAFLACGARHLTLVNPAYSEEKALHYYDTATRYLLKNLQNPNRDTIICATTAVILNVYEIMSERALQRMNHIAGARALIKECGWTARSTGIGAACFWLNVGLEVLSCLHFNWQVAWDPDDWGLDMDFSREIVNGREEVWTHRMLYIIARVCNFRARIPRYTPETVIDPRDEALHTQQRYEEWASLKAMADAWNEGIPRTMQPMAYLHPFQPGASSKSLFPEVWLVKRTTIVARLFYHTALLLLAQCHPYLPISENREMAELQRKHSQMICGITAHVKDRGVASVAIRSLHHAAETLTDRREQEEVISVFDKINKETGWRIGFVYKDLKEKWGWGQEPSPREFAQTHTAAIQQKAAAQEALQQQQLQMSSQHALNYAPQHSVVLAPPLLHPPPTPQAAARKGPPAGIPNPMYKTADFSLPQHPYQNFYVAPSQGAGNGGFMQDQHLHQQGTGTQGLYYGF